jgi:putative nucleotidyltransferase with HDIG domain
MKSLDLLTQRIETWRQKYKSRFSYLFAYQITDTSKLRLKRAKQKINNSVKVNKRYRRRNSLVLLVIALIALTSVSGYRFYHHPQLTVGKVAPVRIKAPRNGQFEDLKTTGEKRKEVQTGVVPILKQNREITAQIRLQLEKYLSQIEQLRNLSQPFPFIDSKILSLESQKYLRSASDLELEKIVNLVNNSKNNNFLNSGKFKQIEQIASELKSYRQQSSAIEFESLLAKITLSRYQYFQSWQKLQQKRLVPLNEEEISTLLDLDYSTWTSTKKAILQAAERILIQGIPPGMPSNLLEEAVTVQLGLDIPPQTSHLASNLLLEILHPNLEEDPEATRNMAEKAALAIEPVIVEINQGEVIVDKGEIITQADFVLLDGFGLSRRSINWHGLELSALIVLTLIVIFLLIQKQVHPFLRQRDYILLCLLSLTSPLLMILRIPHSNLATIGLLVSSFYSPGLAIAQVSLLTGLLMFSTEAIGWDYLLAAIAGGILAAAIAGKLRSREAMARLGIIVGLTQAMVYLIISLIISASATSIWWAVLPEAMVNGLAGVAWSIIALGISPYLERLFDVVTPIRLAELSNPNLPLLKRLATETPGTFQHTMLVASLAEAAARELHCNVELIRAGTLYHDIGKMHDPLGFIENQMGGPNKHDEIDNPWESAEIIKKHVTEGLVMARKYGLPKAIRDFIPEHQGTLLIAYFYHQAQQKAKNDPNLTVLESDFRYDGPIPQSREAGIMMLADGCEAALRSLKEATPEQALTMVKKIFRARWQDGQLLDSGLRYEEFPIIADVFVRVWQQCNHKRIAYPKTVFNPGSYQK